MPLKSDNLKAIGSLIKMHRVAREMTAQQLADTIGISGTHVSYIERGQRRPSFDILANIFNALGLSLDETLSDFGLRSGDISAPDANLPRRIPVISWVTAGLWHEVSDAYEPGDGDEWIKSDIKGDNVFALRITGDSMEPEFSEGEIITINPHLEAVPGDFIVIKNQSGEATFKQLKKYGENWVLHPLNPRYEDISINGENMQIIGKVVKKEKRY